MANIFYRSGALNAVPSAANATNGSVARALTNEEIDKNFFALNDAAITIGTTGIKPSGSSLTLAGLTSVTSTSFIGNASTATKLATARAINGQDFDGTAAITVTAAAATLTGATLNSTITSSSLTKLGTAAGLVKSDASGNLTVDTSTYLTSYVDTNTITRLRGTATGTYTSGDLTLLAGTNVSITQAGSDYTINSSYTDTNTTYTAGTGLTLTGTVFSANYGTTSTTACVGNDARLSDARPASDVYAWAKAATAPTNTIGAYTFSDTTQSTSSSTGAVVLSGGLGVAKNIYAGGTINGSNLSGTNTGDQTLPTTLPHNGTALSATTGTFSSNVSITGNITASGTITSSSDARIKTNVTKIDGALAKVEQLNGYTFDRTDITTPRQTGVIAQEVLKVLPEAVSGTEDTTYTVAYGNMVGLMIEAIKELNAKVTDLQNQLANK